MRILSTIDRPLADEHVIGVDPPLKPELPGVWRRRINPFTGRSLSDRALTAEQEARAGIQRLRGQGVTAGVISGLDVLPEHDAIGAAPGAARLQLLPGIALAQSGEDIVVGSARSIAVADLPVRARADILDAIAANQPAPAVPPGGAAAGPDDQPGGAFAALYPLAPRRLAKALSGLISAPAASALPRVAVLVAQPVTATILAQPRDACAPDPRDDPYDDLQLIDGVRLMLDFWPSEMTARAGGPDYSLPSPGASLRNRLAHRVFGVERNMLPGEIHPWEALGVPLALLGFNADWTLAFMDRASVVRLGGRPNPRTPLVPHSGNPVLWQARVAQFAEQIGGLGNFDPATLAATFRQLPPVGFLPIEVVDLATRRQRFFPAGFGLSMAPMPLEQIDLVVAESAALSPINLDVTDEIELLVPVPERLYEPGLLETAAVDHVFEQAITRAVGDRTRWLVRRETVRRRRDVLLDGATGQRSAWPTVDAADEILPDSEARAPVGCTVVREMSAPANGAPSVLGLSQAGSSLGFDPRDTVYLWVKVIDASGLTGLSLSFGANTRAGGGDFSTLTFWGAADALPGLGGPQAATLRQGELPPAGRWARLEASVDRAWTTTGKPLAGVIADGLQIGQRGGKVQYGPLGKISAGGAETVWVGDDAPPGSNLFCSLTDGWPQAEAGLNAGLDPGEDDFGTAASDGVREAGPLLAFRARWTQTFLAADFADLDEGGIDGFMNAVNSRLKATNDAIDLGFVRARSDIYRVRQYMLGADTASRLVTSPALADLSVREESARAKNLDIAAFVKTAFVTDVQSGVAPAAPSAPSNPGSSFKPFISTLLFENFNPAPKVNPPERIAQRLSLAPTRFRAVAGGAAGVVGAVTTMMPSATSAARPKISFQQLDSPLLSLAALRAGRAVSNRNPGAIDVQSSTPLPGAVERTASVAERLKPPPAVEAYHYAIAGKQAVLTAIAGLIGGAANGRPPGIALGDLPCPGFRAPPLPTDPAAPVPPLAAAPRNTVADVIAFLAKTPGIPAYQDTDEMKDGGQGAARHESDYFTAAVGALDNSIALMRLVEARIDLYGKLIDDAGAVRDELMDHIADSDARLRTIGVHIEEARQDFGVATALLAEETARVDALNARRRAILDANANVVLFRRPRRARRVRAITTAPATAALEAAPILACAREHPATPEEIQVYVGLMRRAPVAWFPAVHPELERIDRLDSVRAALAAVQARAAQPVTPWTSNHFAIMSRMLAAAGKVIEAQQMALAAWSLYAAQMNAAAIAATNLAHARQVLLQNAAMADMIAGEHNRAALARAAAQEIEQLGMAAACLHDSFGETPATDRLQWAEMLSEFDAPAPLRDLNDLIGWSDMDIELRKTQQGLVDWLFSRIDQTIPAAVTAINELVRICLLMAAHAPVDRLIPARLVGPVPLKIGGRMSLYADVSVARIGMTALIRDASSKLIAHAIVEDLQDGVAHTRIVKAFQAIGVIGPSARIDLSDVRLVL